MHDQHLPLKAREAAMKALGAYRRNKTWPEMSITSLIDNRDMSSRDMALTVQMFKGVLQNTALCDYYLSYFSSRDLKKIEPRVLDILRLSIYQIIFLSRVPNSAAVNEGVALAKKYSNNQAAGFVNAILRKVSRSAENSSLPDISGELPKRLSVKYSHPEWIIKEFCGLLGPDGTEALLSANNAPDIPVTAQVNTLLSDTNSVLAALEYSGVEADRHDWLDNCIELRSAGSIDSLEPFIKGHIYIQDAAARLAVTACSPKSGDFLIDGCAAPGGKSFSAAVDMKNLGRIMAFDIRADKLRYVTEGAKRLGIDIIEAYEKDAAAEDNTGRFTEKADIVLADVPCSGLGIIRKRPDIRYKSENDINGLPEIQKKILNGLSKKVKPGGVLLYSTCTFLRRENEDVIEAFLRENGDFSPECFILPSLGYISAGMITLWPHIHRTDGFFICKLRKAE